MMSQIKMMLILLRWETILIYMKMSMKIKNIKAFLLGGIVFSVLTGVALMSYTSAAGNEIQGCVGQNGALRIIGAGSSKEKCKKSDLSNPPASST